MTTGSTPTPLTYTSYISTVAVMAAINVRTTTVGYPEVADPVFLSIVPAMLNYAELRIQRDLDLIALQTTKDYPLVQGDTTLQLPESDFVTVQNLFLKGADGKFAVLTPTTKEFLMTVYPDSSEQGKPRYFAPIGGDNHADGPTEIVYAFAPALYQDYTAYVTGSARMKSLWSYAVGPEASTATTFISQNLPDLLVMASMVYISAYQRNFSAASDDPQMAVNYEKQYMAMAKGAMSEEARKRFRASAWSSEAAAPAATPVRA
jgi:hypothetical protein